MVNGERRACSAPPPAGRTRIQDETQLASIDASVNRCFLPQLKLLYLQFLCPCLFMLFVGESAVLASSSCLFTDHRWRVQARTRRTRGCTLPPRRRARGCTRPPRRRAHSGCSWTFEMTISTDAPKNSGRHKGHGTERSRQTVAWTTQWRALPNSVADHTVSLVATKMRTRSLSGSRILRGS